MKINNEEIKAEMEKSGDTRRTVKKRLRQQRKKEWEAQYIPYWLNFEHKSQAGVTYYNLEHNKQSLTPVYDKE